MLSGWLRFVGCAGLAVTAGCAGLPGGGQRGADERELARSVVIVRDEWGVPHIQGPTDASVAFGAAFAQAEDNYWQIEEDYMHALGRASYYYGEHVLVSDVVHAAFEVERLSREEYAREPVQRRAVWDGYAAGLNYYLRVSGLRPRVIARWEPWMVFARVRSALLAPQIDGVVLDSLSEQGGVQLTGRVTAAADAEDAGALSGDGSIAAAIAPQRSATQRALLLQSVVAPLFGRGQLYEMHLQSEQGWHVRGFALLGLPVPHIAHNERLGWSHTRSTADVADVYAVRFAAGDALVYDVDGTPQRATEWLDTLQVNTMQGVTPRVFRFRRTQHGPVVAVQDERLLAVRSARIEEGGALQQWYAMGRARDRAQFDAALALRALPFNTTYADAAGSVYHVHGNAVPVRDAALDWGRPVDGNTAQTQWRGYHELRELPQANGAADGVVSSDMPLAASGAAWPSYMRVAARGPERLRLPADSAISAESLARAAYSSDVQGVAEQVQPLVMEWEDVGGRNPQRAMQLDEAVDLLRAWDGRVTVESPAATLYLLWQERLRGGAYEGSFARLRALEDVVRRLQQDWRRTRVAWGELNRLQRIEPGVSFSDARESLPVAGVPAWAGGAFTWDAAAVADARRRYGLRGSHIGVVEFGERARASSIVPFGQSADPASPVHFDQASLYSAGRLKPASFERAEVATHARRSYRPSESVTVPLRRP